MTGMSGATRALAVWSRRYYNVSGSDVRADARGRGRQGPEFRERSGRGAAALGAISHQVLTAGVRDVESVAA
jgi:hypothetical protein